MAKKVVKGANDLTLIQLNNYVKPEIKEEKSKGFVTNGVKNSYFHYVNDRYIGSPTNSAIINGYKSWVYGKGLSAKDQSKKPNQYARLYSMLKEQDVKSIVSDFVTQNMAYMQIIRNRDNTISTINHIAVDKIAPEIANEDNVIEAYYYSNDFSDRQAEPQRIPAFGVNKKPQPLEIYCIKPYQLGMEYFALPTYQSGLQFAELEEEVSNYCINHIKRGLSFGSIISIPDGYNLEDEQKAEIERKLKQKLTGSNNAGNVVIDFANGENRIEVTAIDINEAHSQWQFLSEESSRKIITAHEVVSPMLFGIKDSAGFSSNADELGEAERQTIDRVINPKQNYIINALKDVLKSDDITLELYFIPLSEEKTTSDGSFTGVQISSAIDIITKVKTGELTEREASSLLKSMLGYPEDELNKLFKTQTQTSLSTEKKTEICCSEDVKTPSEEVTDLLISLGEEESEQWDLLCSSEVEYDTDSDLHGYLNLATSTGVARPNAKSEQDSEDIKIRYRYVGNPRPQRAFCVKMMNANKLYRKEDILQMERQGINDGFGLNGTNSYSIWLWKGGGKMSEKYPNGTCKHKWQREIYLKKNGNVDVNSPLADKITTSEARRKGYKVPTNNTNVSVTPHNNK